MARTSRTRADRLFRQGAPVAFLIAIAAWPGPGWSAARGAPAWESAPFSGRQAATASGVAVVEARGGPGPGQTFRVTVGRSVVLTTDPAKSDGVFADFPIPDFIAHFSTPGLAAQDVIVVQQDATGNACDGGPLWLLILGKGRAPKLTPPIDWCGGPPPQVRAEGAKIVIRLPATPPSGQKGSGGVRGETWVFEAGRLRRISR
jgi:hypothetical protein